MGRLNDLKAKTVLVNGNVIFFKQLKIGDIFEVDGVKYTAVCNAYLSLDLEAGTFECDVK